MIFLCTAQDHMTGFYMGVSAVRPLLLLQRFVRKVIRHVSNRNFIQSVHIQIYTSGIGTPLFIN